MLRTLMLAAVVAMLMTTTVASALAVGGGPYAPKYRVTGNGVLVYEGDARIHCRDVFRLAENADPSDAAALKGSIRACMEAGLSGRGRIPKTGGPSLLLAMGVVLLISGACVRRLAYDRF